MEVSQCQSPVLPSVQGGALAVLLVLVSLIACAESSKSPSDDTDVTVDVLLDDNEISSRSLTSTTEEYNTSYTSSDLYWTYTAVKQDGYFTTGQVTEETFVYTDDNGEAVKGLPSALPGKFSVGDWLFSFYAYTPAADDDENESVPWEYNEDTGTYSFSSDCLYYTATDNAETVSLSSSSNTVKVNVQLYEAVKNADENGNTYGTLSITLDDLGLTESFSVTVQAGSNDAVTAATYTYSDSSWSVEGNDLMGLTGDADSYTVSLTPGYYSVTVTATTGSGAEYSATEDDVLIKPNLTTALTGSLEVANNAALYAALVSGGSVTLTKDFTLSSSYLPSGTYITSASELTIDLNGHTLSATTASGTFKIPASSDVTVKNGTFSVTRGGSTSDSSSVIAVFGGGSLTLESVTLETGGSTIILMQGSTLNITDSNVSSTGYCTICTANSYYTITDTSAANYYTYVNIENSKIASSNTSVGDGDGGGTALFLNIPGVILTVESSTLIGTRQAMVFEYGTATVKDSTLISLGTLTGNSDMTTSTSWSGNNVPYTTLVAGTNKNSYADSSMSIELNNTTLSMVTNEVDHNDNEFVDLAYVGGTCYSGNSSNNVSLTYDSSTTGTVYTYAYDDDGNKASTATATNVSDILTEGHTYIYADSSTTVTVTNSSEAYTYSGGYGVYGSDTLTNSSSS